MGLIKQLNGENDAKFEARRSKIRRKWLIAGIAVPVIGGSIWASTKWENISNAYHNLNKAGQEEVYSQEEINRLKSVVDNQLIQIEELKSELESQEGCPDSTYNPDLIQDFLPFQVPPNGSEKILYTIDDAIRKSSIENAELDDIISQELFFDYYNRFLEVNPMSSDKYMGFLATNEELSEGYLQFQFIRNRSFERFDVDFDGEHVEKYEVDEKFVGYLIKPSHEAFVFLGDREYLYGDAVRISVFGKTQTGEYHADNWAHIFYGCGPLKVITEEKEKSPKETPIKTPTPPVPVGTQANQPPIPEETQEVSQ